MRRPGGIGAVIEGERHLARHRPEAVDDVGSRQLGVGLVVDVAGIGIDLDGADARFRPRLDAKDLALSLEVDVVAGADGLERVGRRRAIGTTDHRPQRGVFRAEAPDGVAGRLVDVGGVDFVVGGDAVEEPDVVGLAVVLDVGEVRIFGIGVEGDIDLGLARRLQRLLESEVFGDLAFHPIIAIAADGDDGVGRIEVLHALVERLFEPILAGDGAGAAFGPMLVIGHQDQVVSDRGVGFVIPIDIVVGHGEAQGQPERLEGGHHLLEERLEVALCGRGHFFEVDRQALEFVGGDEGDDVLEARSARHWIGEELGEAGAVPVAVGRILDHRQDRRAGLGAGDEVDGLGVEIGRQRHRRAIDA